MKTYRDSVGKGGPYDDLVEVVKWPRFKVAVKKTANMVVLRASPRQHAIRIPIAERRTNSKGFYAPMGSNQLPHMHESMESKPILEPSSVPEIPEAEIPTVIFIYGRPADSYSKEELIGFIAEMSKQIESMHINHLDALKKLAIFP